MEKEILRMQIRLFRMACKRWGMNTTECVEIFEKYNIDKYISDLYEIFHVQGDESNLDEIEMYMKNKGANYAFI